MWIERDIESLLATVAGQRPALVLSGCRQAGKTSLLQHVFPDAGYVSLDLPLTAAEAEESGQQFLAQHPTPLVLDEIQYAPSLLRHLKGAIDAARSRNGQYLMTGSNRFALMEGITESLAGRIAVLDCHTLSAIELERCGRIPISTLQLPQLIFEGGYPELHVSDLDPQRFFSDYVATYLERDVRSVLGVRSLRDFQRFMRLAALRSGQLLSISGFAGELGLSPTTVKHWLSVLEASGIVLLLEPYLENLGKRLVRTPKLYFLDTGLACFLCGLRSADDLRDLGLLGAMFETHVLGQIVRWHANRGHKPPLYFYRDHSGHEVDFVLTVGRKLKLYECKWSETARIEETGLLDLERIIGPQRVLSKTLVTSVRGHRRVRESNAFVEDSIELKSLTL